jgi:hypothetical protein
MFSSSRNHIYYWQYYRSLISFYSRFRRCDAHHSLYSVTIVSGSQCVSALDLYTKTGHCRMQRKKKCEWVCELDEMQWQ